MIDRLKVLFKSITGEIDTPRALWKLIRTTVGYVSSFFTFSVFLKDFIGFANLEEWVKAHWLMVVITGLVISCLCNREKLNCCKKVSNSDMQIEVSVGDIFSNWTANSYVIPTNTFFSY